MTTHLLIAGHGKRRNGTFDPGATGFISKGEHKYMSEDLFPAMKKFLPDNHKVIFFDNYNVYDHGNIVDLAKKYNADEVTEFHFDAASPSATGGHVIVYSGYAPDETDLALRDVIDGMVGTRYSHRNHKGISGRNNLANVNRTASAGVTYRLVELGFGTNENDAKIMTENVEEYAKKLVEVFVGESKSVTPKKKKVSTSKPKKQVKTTKNKASLKIDGKWGNDTTRALQKALGTPIDSIISNQRRNSITESLYGNTVRFSNSGNSNVIVALQSKVGATQDGLLGRQTVTRLQRYLGTVQDGILSRPSLVVEELQRRLNAGTF